MQDNRTIITQYHDGTLAANVARKYEFPVNGRFKWAKAHASNDSSGTLALASAGGMSIAAQAIGDSGDPATIVPATTDTDRFSKDDLITVTLDFDGASGTAAADVEITMCFELGHG